MAFLDDFLMEELSKQASSQEVEFNGIVNQIIDSFKRQIVKDPFKDRFIVNVIRSDDHLAETLSPVVKHGKDPAKVLFYLKHGGTYKISQDILVVANLETTKNIQLILINKHVK